MKPFAVLILCCGFLFGFVSISQSRLIASLGASFAGDTSHQTDSPADTPFVDADAAAAIANLTYWVKPVERFGRLAPVESATGA